MTLPDPLFAVLLVSGFVIVAVLFRLHCMRHGRLHVNPFLGLLGGVLYYVFTPCTAIGLFGDAIADLTVFEDYFTVTHANEVLAYTVALLAATTVGALLPQRLVALPARRRARPGPSVAARNSTASVPWLAFWIAFASLLMLSLSIREFLFAGYDERVLESDAVWAVRGTISSLYSMMVVCATAATFWSGGRPPRRSRLAIGLAFVLASLLLLSIGARLYVAMALISLMALVSSLQDGIRLRRFLPALLVMAALFAVVGTLRTGSIDSVGSVLLNMALEPLLTSLSLFTLLGDNPVIWLGKVHLFPGDFQAVLPSVLFPGKALLFDRLNDYGYDFQAPLGGYHLYFSTLINFGIIGSVALAVPFGFVLRRLGNAPLIPYRVAPVSAVFMTGAFMFTFFRDPFFISLVKNVFITGIVVPIVLVGLERARRVRRKRPDPSGPPAAAATIAA